MCSNEKESSEEPGSSSVLYLFSVLLVKLQVKYKLSDSVMTALISILQLIFTLTSHPLQYSFPRTLHSLFMIAGINQLPEYQKFVVCPDPRCCNLHKDTLLSEASNIPLCAKQTYNSQCTQQLGYKKFLSFGKIRLAPYKTFVYLSPIVWLKKFTASKHLSSFFTFNRDIPLTVDILMMCGMVEFGNHLIEITVKTVF